MAGSQYEQVGAVAVSLDPVKLAQRIATFLNGVPAIASSPTDAALDTYINGLSDAAVITATRAFLKALITITGPPAKP
jgi:hypothetical protein